MATYATLALLTSLLALAALAGSARSHRPNLHPAGSLATPKIHELYWLRGQLNHALAARCLPARTYRWRPAYRVPPGARTYVIQQTRGLLQQARARARACSPVEIGRLMAAARGWVGGEWDALYELWRRESGWNPCRHYPSTTNCAYTGSNACGIPQRVPCAGLIQQSVRAQIRWGLGYIAGRYGSPSGALAHSNSAGWY